MTHDTSATPLSASTRTPRAFGFRVPATLLLLFTALATPACIAGSGDVDSEDDGSGYDAISGGTAVSRADEWANAKLHYCQSANHQRDYDAACSEYCERQNNSTWDPYRSDCSGLVSWAWGLSAPGRVTTEFAPFEDDITHAISASSLQPGDAVNNSDHIMLFKNWVHQGTEATFIEEPGCSSSTPYAHEVTSNVSISGQTIHVYYNGMTFTAIRYDGIGSGGSPPNGPPSCSVGGVEGSCIETSACGAKAGHHSTPGYCPGPANEECCTPNASPPSPPPTCHAGGVAGTCISTSSCAAKGGHHSTPGDCPGPASEECCTPNSSPPPPPPPSGPSCTVEGIEGVCISKSSCSGEAGHVSTPGFCPGPASEECCTKPKTCDVGGKAGMCVETSVCAGLHKHSTPGYCPGPANEECCTP